MGGLGHEGGGDCLKCLKWGWNRTEGRGHKDLKKGGQAGSRGWNIKKGEGWTGTPLWTMEVSGPDCLAVVVLRKCEPELSYMLAELFNLCLKESCFLGVISGTYV